MIGLYCIAAGGLLMSLQHRCQRKFDEVNQPSMQDIERQLDAENERLDAEIELLLTEHKSLSNGYQGDIPKELHVTPEMEERFLALEEEVRNGEK